MRDAANWTMETKSCLTCKMDFTRPVWRKAIYCSKRCKAKIAWNKGLTGLGGFKWSEESKKRLSEEKTGKKVPLLQGKNHYLWVADRSKLKLQEERGGPRHREWSKQVKNRDYWKCQISNDDCSGHVVAHHILSWRDHEKLRYEIKNGITLCHFHHPRRRVDEERYVIEFQQLIAAKM